MTDFTDPSTNPSYAGNNASTAAPSTSINVPPVNTQLAQQQPVQHIQASPRPRTPQRTPQDQVMQQNQFASPAVVEEAQPQVFTEKPAQTPTHVRKKKPQICEISSGEFDGRFQRLSKLLGKGANKEVYLGFDTENNNDVAWNRMVCGEQARTVREKEISILSECDHVNIIKYLGTWESENYFIFITEFFSGSLKQYIQEREVLIKSVKTWTKQILSGLAHLHQRGIIHRDIKSDNIFINQKTGDVVIGDLGLSRMETEHRSMSMVGTVPFMAPEQLNLDERHYDAKVDIYALGMTVIEMITNEFPYDEVESLALIIRNIMENRPPNAFLRIKESPVKDFISKMIARIPSQRPSADELLQDEWLINARAEDNEFCHNLCIPKTEISPIMQLLSSGATTQPNNSEISHAKPAANVLDQPPANWVDDNQFPKGEAEPYYTNDVTTQVSAQPGYAGNVMSVSPQTAVLTRIPTPGGENRGPINLPKRTVMLRLDTVPVHGNSVVSNNREFQPKQVAQIQPQNEPSMVTRGDESSHMETEEMETEQAGEISNLEEEEEEQEEDPKLILQRHIENLESLQGYAKNIDWTSISTITFLVQAMETIQRAVDNFISEIQVETDASIDDPEPEDDDLDEENENKKSVYDIKAQELLTLWNDEKEGLEMWLKKNKNDLNENKKQTKDIIKNKKEKDEQKEKNQNNIEGMEQLNIQIQERRDELQNEILELERQLEQKRNELTEIEKKEQEIAISLENSLQEAESINEELTDLENKLKEFNDEDKKIGVRCVQNWMDAVESVMENINVHNWKEWNHDRIVDWICSINNGELKGYKDTLEKNVPELLESGEDLNLVDKALLLEMGVRRIRDRMTILNHIKGLPNAHVDEQGGKDE